MKATTLSFIALACVISAVSAALPPPWLSDSRVVKAWKIVDRTFSQHGKLKFFKAINILPDEKLKYHVLSRVQNDLSQYVNGRVYWLSRSISGMSIDGYLKNLIQEYYYPEENVRSLGLLDDLNKQPQTLGGGSLKDAISNLVKVAVTKDTNGLRKSGNILIAVSQVISSSVEKVKGNTARDQKAKKAIGIASKIVEAVGNMLINIDAAQGDPANIFAAIAKGVSDIVAATGTSASGKVGNIMNGVSGIVKIAVSKDSLTSKLASLPKAVGDLVSAGIAKL